MIGINRYIMECKYKDVFPVLPPRGELIDTLWNVNNEETNTEENKTGINRYIMECKYKFAYHF